VTPLRSRRSVRIVAWLLTPVVAWAASFLGGWIGLLLGRARGDANALVWGGVGAVVAALAAVIAWVLRLRIGARRDAGSGSHAPDAPPDDANEAVSRS
jgi:hypothetical protein